MTVLSYALGDLFTIRIIKHHTNNPERHWANSYEVRANGAGDTGDLITLGTTLVEFEQRMHRDFVVFDRLLISTWAPDSVPYDPAAFISTGLTVNGTLTTLTDAAALTTTLRVTRQAVGGRFGNLFYRGYLMENQISSPAGTQTLTNRADVQTALNAARDDSNLADYLGDPGAGIFSLVLVSSDGANIRNITALAVAGTTALPLNHAWFNRSSPSLP